MALIDDVKNALRINNAPVQIEEDLKSSVNAALLSLAAGGVKYVETLNAESEAENALITHAVVLFCKAYFSENPKAEKYAATFEKLKNALGASSKYGDVDNV